MIFGRKRDAFDLLGQTEKFSAPLRLSAGDQAPELGVAWGSFRQSLWSSLRAAFFGPSISKKLRRSGFFKDCCIEGRVPARAVLAAALWHVFFIIVPLPKFAGAVKKNPALDNFELTWSGPAEDLPILKISRARAERSIGRRPLPEKRDADAPEGTDAFHPRQRIFIDPAHPNHPRQTLINPAAPAEPPKILSALPNIVEFQARAAPPRPRMEISAETLARLRPRERRVATIAADAPRPDLAAPEQKAGEVPLALSPNAPARPKLELNAGAAPRLAQKARTGDAGPAPELGAPQQSNAGASAATLIALSAAPAPPGSNVQVPQGNLAARIALSPEGKSGAASVIAAASGSGGTSAGGAAGENSIGISISGGNPVSKNGTLGGTSGGTSGLGGAVAARSSISSPTRHVASAMPEPRVARDDAPARTGPPQFSALAPGAAPEQIFAEKRIYKMLVNMPNLNSSTGSWVLNFSELRADPGAPHMTSADLTGPVPIRKIDPKYPPALIGEHVEGEVVLYAVIRRDGSIDSIQLVQGLDEQLDANAMSALSQWKFRPGSKQGVPVELEAIVHIPFHAPINR